MPLVLNATLPTDWQAAGTATFTDGWIMPYFSVTTTADMTWQVNIQKSASSEFFRIVAPYEAKAFLDNFNIRPNVPAATEIIFDCTDPDFVRVAFTPILTFAEGVFSSNEQTVWGSSRADYYESLGRTPQAITEAGLNNTFTNQIITIRECTIGFTPEPSSASQTWNTGAFPCTLNLNTSSIETIGADSPASYIPVAIYNLQGMPIDQPAHGQPCIARYANGTTRIWVP